MYSGALNRLIRDEDKSKVRFEQYPNPNGDTFTRMLEDSKGNFILLGSHLTYFDRDTKNSGRISLYLQPEQYLWLKTEKGIYM